MPPSALRVSNCPGMRSLGRNGSEGSMPADFEVIDARFRMLIQPNSWVQKLHSGMLWAEGPVYFADGNYLLWSDIPNSRIMQYVEGLGVRIWREDSNHSNGN